MARTPQIVLRPIGQSFPYLSVPGSDQIRGILIDNPSGSWLLLRPTNDYIPPYTLDWARSFAGGQASISVSYESPAGQVSTLQGDPAIIVLDSEPVPDSAGKSGVPFVAGFTPVLSALLGGGAGLHVTTLANTVGTWIAAIPNMRVRLLTIEISYLGNGVFPSTNESPLELLLIDSVTNLPVQFFGLNGAQRMQAAIFPSGLDLSRGARLDYQTVAHWADVFLSGSITYQVI